jgi:hypothetical protein
MSKTQLRGICQCCGRQQAVLQPSGRMSKHGYTVGHGWFSGVCTGQNYQPLQKDRAQADIIVAAVRRDVVSLRAKAAAFRANEIHPELIRTNRWDPKTRDTVKIPYEDGTPYQQEKARESAASTADQRANAGVQFADNLERLADRIYGTELEVVPAEEGPEPIPYGQQRKAARGVLTAKSVDRGIVRWQDERGFNGKMSTRSWRLLEKV